MARVPKRGKKERMAWQPGVVFTGNLALYLGIREEKMRKNRQATPVKLLATRSILERLIHYTYCLCTPQMRKNNDQFNGLVFKKQLSFLAGSSLKKDKKVLFISKLHLIGS